MSIGFIGLGIMGDGMSRCLLKKGDKLAVWNRSPAKCEALKAEYPDSVTICKTPAEVITTCQLTFVMLSTPEAVKEVYEAEGTGILAGLATALEDMADGVGSGKQIVDCATLAVTDMERLFSQVHGKQATFLEAPVSGSKGPAAQGQLIFLCGGSETLYTAIGPHLDAMGKAKFFLGPVGAGTKMKLCVNMTMGSMLAAYGESLSLATSSGLDSKQLLEVLGLGVCASPLMALKGQKMIDGDYAPNFPLKHAEKDMRLAIELGALCQVKLPVAAAADDTMLAAMSAPDMPNKDFAAAYEAQKYGFKRGWAASIPGGRNIMAGFKTVVGGVGGALDSARSVTNQLAKNSKKEEESRQKEESKAGEAKSPRPVEVK